VEDLGSDVLGVTTHAEMMTPEEIEEMIDYILNEVLLFSVVIVNYSPTSRIEHSMGKILLVAT